MNAIALVLLSCLSLLPLRAADPTPANMNTNLLWYDKPAQSAMNEALPIGNGRLGGVVFGGTSHERFAFNEDSLWTGGTNPTGDYDSMGAYQAFGDVVIDLPGHDTSTEYRRDLDLATAAAHVRYKVGGVTYAREYMASFPNQVVAIRLTADMPGSYTGRISLHDAHGATARVVGRQIAAAGALDNGLTYASGLEVIPEGGTTHETPEGAITFTGCDSLTILLVAGTSYAMNSQAGFRGADPKVLAESRLRSAAELSYSALRTAQEKDFQALFGRVSLDLGKSPADRAALPTDRRKLLAAVGDDPELESLLFQYGRYLLISCSRPGSLPANLQGLWNDSNSPPWHSDYHANINVQMNYWPTEVAGLPECALPFFDLVRSQLPGWRVATQGAVEYKLAGGSPVRGWALRTSHNTMGGMGWDWDKAANAWYCSHFYEHYAFTGDKVFLKTVAYPVMKETCEFWEDHLKTLPDGRLVVPMGWSPEHGPVEDGVSYNQEIVWDLFRNFVQASTALGIDADYRARIAGLRDKLVVPAIGHWGQLQEWMTDRDDLEDHHRHTSHLFGVFPGRQFTFDATPNKMAAAKKSLLARGDSGDVREWSFAWRTALFARMHDGDDAHGQLRQLFSDRNTCPNLFGLHPPMQMDGNFGITAGIAEMLLQSHAGEIDLLPALPAAWPNGSMVGLRARGGFIVDQTWAGGKLVSATIHSAMGGSCRVRNGAKTSEMNVRRGGTVRLDGDLRGLR